MGDSGDLLGGVGREIEFVVDEGGGWRAAGLQAKETRVGACAEGDDLFLGGGRGGQEAVDYVVDCRGADIGAW